ncbi:MAG: phosphoribosylanthranilate isomerase [Ignavibacterium sp.]|nr:MAG: phosphoribosylanthranilate isomerase [Ignavibacterium sp.]
MKIKVCGITNSEDAVLAEMLGADALGFIFYKKSKRYVSPDAVKAITKKLSPFTTKVGVFANESPEMINKITKAAGINVVQLHGNEERDTISKISLPVIKAFRIDDNFNFKQLENFNDYPILLDAHSSKEYGGTGQKFNWEMIPDSIRSKIILAGGVSVENLDFISKNIKPAGIDLSSSIETEPGKKDKEKMKEFFNKVNQLRRQ